MPRGPREKSVSGIYHVMLRGINRQVIFEDHEDRSNFLRTLSRIKDKLNYKLYGYCLMNNHVHLIVKEEEASVSSIMQRFGMSYVYWYNRKYERSGPLFQGRFRSESIYGLPYFLRVLRYVHQNPMKAGVAGSVGDSPWTSFNDYLNDADDTLVDTDFALSFLSPKPENARELFVTYMQDQNDDLCLEHEFRRVPKDEAVLEKINELGHTVSSLQKLEKFSRNQVIYLLKEIPYVTTNQLSRVTGISRSVINNVR